MANKSLAISGFVVALIATLAICVGLATPSWISTVLKKIDITLGIFQICEAGYGNSACSSIVEYVFGDSNDNLYAMLLPPAIFTAIKVVLGTLTAAIILSFIALVLLGQHVCGDKEGGKRGPVIGGTFLLVSAILSIAGIASFIGILLAERQKQSENMGALAGIKHLVISMGYSFWLTCVGAVFTLISSSLAFFSL